jgi:hypothetical protein
MVPLHGSCLMGRTRSAGDSRSVRNRSHLYAAVKGHLGEVRVAKVADDPSAKTRPHPNNTLLPTVHWQYHIQTNTSNLRSAEIVVVTQSLARPGIEPGSLL